jgi:hypothetical protein
MTAPTATMQSQRLSQLLSFVPRGLRRAVPALAVALVALAGASGCENKAIGRLCDVQADGGTNQGLWNTVALECPSQICIKQPLSGQVATDPKTAPFCSAECSNDSDCQDGLTATPGKDGDRRCRKGFSCGVAFEVGQLCCKKLCLCRDFLPPGVLTPPASCGANSTSTCVNRK